MPLSAPFRRKDDGTGRALISATCHVSRGNERAEVSGGLARVILVQTIVTNS